MIQGQSLADLEAEFPEKLGLLFQPARYKVLYGGRGGAKSWSVARALLIIGAQRPLRVLCARELQSSIADSVHKLLSDQVQVLGLQNFYEVQRASIRGINGTEFSFAGIRHNVGSIKSYEGVDVCWVEEAQNVSKSSWETLLPTIRKEGSEIWITFNPELDSDETWKRFVVNPPPGALIQKITWRDNPWFPAPLQAEMEHLRATDRDAWLCIWEGNTRHVLDGAVYARELRAAVEEDRIGRVPYDHSKPVHTFWDLGWSDLTSIWLAQIVGFEYRIIDFHQDRHRTVEHYLRVLQGKGYVYGTDYLPHDGAKGQLGSGGRSIRDMMVAAGRKVQIVPNLAITDGINAARTLFPNCFFDSERCADGLQALRHYRYDIDQQTGQYSRNPLHDEHSHAADAFRYLAVALREVKPGMVKLKPVFKPAPSLAEAWMG
jgi:phage terminase large subunit